MTATPPPTPPPPASPPAHPRPRWLDLGLLVVLGGLIAIPALGTLTRLDEVESASENRPLATWPSGGPPAAWRDRVQAFLDDRFGGRELLLRARSSLYLTLGESPLDAVVLGEEGWLYYGDEERGGLLGVRALDEAGLAAWVEALDRRQRWADALGVPYVLVIGPDKHTIYPEHLPPGYAPPSPAPFDRLLEHLARVRPQLRVLDVRDAMRAAKGEALLYWPQDTHWTSNGALVAAQAVVDEARRSYPELAPLTREELDAWTPPQPKRDLADMLATPERFDAPAGVGVAPRDPSPRLRAEVFSDSYGLALLPLLKARFDCVEPLHTDQLLRADVAPLALVLDVLVERKLARADPPLPDRGHADFRRVEPVGRFRACPRELMTLEGEALRELEVGALEARVGGAGLVLEGLGPEVLRFAAGARGVSAGWSRLEFEVRDVPHRVQVQQRDGAQADLLEPGVYAVCFPTREVLEVELAATGGAPLAITVRRLELRGE